MTFTNPYLRLMRLDQRAGIWLLLWPCWWSLALAGENRLWVYGAFLAGSVVMRAAGCIINDMCDRDVDAKVARTKTRPLASGEVSMREAGILLVLLIGAALAIALALGMKVVMWAAASLPLIAAYPLMKRITWWPQLFLGITFNWGVLVAWVAVRGDMASPAVILYIACIFWTLGYDTIYAHQDKKDDVHAGVKSTALRLGKNTKSFVGCCYLAVILLFATLIPFSGTLLFLGLVALHFFWQLKMVNLDDPTSCRRIFVSNCALGWIPFLMIILSR